MSAHIGHHRFYCLPIIGKNSAFLGPVPGNGAWNDRHLSGMPLAGRQIALLVAFTSALLFPRSACVDVILHVCVVSCNVLYMCNILHTEAILSPIVIKVCCMDTHTHSSHCFGGLFQLPFARQWCIQL